MLAAELPRDIARRDYAAAKADRFCLFVFQPDDATFAFSIQYWDSYPTVEMWMTQMHGGGYPTEAMATSDGLRALRRLAQTDLAWVEAYLADNPESPRFRSRAERLKTAL